LGYGTIPSGADVSTEIINVFPFMKHEFGLLRHWTIRQRIEDVPQTTQNRDIIQDQPHTRRFTNDGYVTSYLNDECSLVEMVQSVIQSQNRASRGGEDEENECIHSAENDTFSLSGVDDDWSSLPSLEQTETSK
jgi:hypothetical protein